MNAIRQLIAAVHPSALSAPIDALSGDGHLVKGSTSTATRPSSALAALDYATEGLNSPPLTAAGLRGQVVLIEFWTYTCINWLRAQPYVRAWYENLSDCGLVVIGVHAPEFSFEHNIDNLRRAAKDLRVDYPIAVDNDFAIWRGFNNHYWPALYFIDAQGGPHRRPSPVRERPLLRPRRQHLEPDRAIREAVPEVRNRVTLCRCGAYSNKPCCDTSHISVGFRDKSWR